MKCAENWRYDFIEDSIPESVIRKYDLFKLNWTQVIDEGYMDSLLEILQIKFLDVSAPYTTILSERLFQELDRIISVWQETSKPAELADLSSLFTTDYQDVEALPAEDYWLAIQYLESRRQADDRTRLSGVQVLFPASIARYIAAKGPDAPEYVFRPSPTLSGVLMFPDLDAANTRQQPSYRTMHGL